MKSTMAIVCASMLLAGCNSQKESISDMEQQVDELYARMTQEERIQQLRSTYMNDYFTEDGQLDTALCRRDLSFGIGHFSQFASQMSEDPNVIRDRVAVMQEWLISNTPSGIPALFHEEVLTGACTRDATVYPQQIGLACSFNPELAELKARQTGETLRQIGGLLSLSPMVDVVRDPSFNRLEESYGEDGYLSAVFGTAFVRGLQQGDLRKGVGTCSKHYLGYGGGGAAPEKELMEEILLPHETMIRLAGSKAVMTGYHAVDGVSCVANSFIQQDILRHYLHYDGMMVSDYNSVDQIVGITDPLQRCVAAINAGNDVEFPRGDNNRHLQEALDKGLVSQERFEEAVKNVLRYKWRVGLLEKNPVLYNTEHIAFDRPEERQTAYTLALQSIVMLKNDGILPLRPKQKAAEAAGQEQDTRILLTGPNANTMWAMLGDYTFHSMRYFWQVKNEDDMHPKIVNLKDGMTCKMPDGMTLSYTRGCDWTEEIETWIQDGGDTRAEWLKRILDRKVEHPEEAHEAEALRMAAESDVIVAAVGENVLLCGESRERPSLHLPGRQQEFVEHLLATGKPVVLVLFGGRCQIIDEIADRCAAIIQAWYPGEEGGNAVADILYGHQSPSGKLCVSYPRSELHDIVVGQQSANSYLGVPLCYNYQAGLDPRVAWPFGYGLSYASFAYDHLEAPAEVRTTDESFTLSFTIKNTGKVKADEVAQIYLSPAHLDQPIRPIQLQGFARISLEPGQEKTVEVKLYTEQLGYYSHEGERQWNIVPSQYILKVGASSTDIRLQQAVTLKGDVVTKPLRDFYFSETTIK